MSKKWRKPSIIRICYRTWPVISWDGCLLATYVREEMLELLGLGLIAGVLTTVAGMGGGLLLVVTLSAWKGPHFALAVTTPALLLSNLHRAYLFRRVLDTKVAKAFALGAIPGAFAAGWLVPRLPEAALHGVLVAATSLTLARL